MNLLQQGFPEKTHKKTVILFTAKNPDCVIPSMTPHTPQMKFSSPCVCATSFSQGAFYSPLIHWFHTRLRSQVTTKDLGGTPGYPNKISDDKGGAYIVN